jgi:hypothetical protein
MLLVLALGAWCLWHINADPGEAAEIQRLADLVGRKDYAALKKEAAALVEKYQKPGRVMKLFRKRAEEGGGVFLVCEMVAAS